MRWGEFWMSIDVGSKQIEDSAKIRRGKIGGSWVPTICESLGLLWKNAKLQG